VQSGMWSGTVSLPIVSVNAALMANGNILFYDGQLVGSSAIVWNYGTNVINWAPAPVNIFCTRNGTDGRRPDPGGWRHPRATT
jgi:hypothetical protein